MNTRFEPRHTADIARLISDYPLAWVSSPNLHASPLPLIAETGPNGEVTALFGHCARANPLVADFRENPRGLILFNGPQGYISPALLSQPDWAPTWNYAILRFTVEVSFVELETDDAIQRLSTKMEGDDWSTDRVGPRYHAMLERIIAFRAKVVSADHCFKLGQDEGETGFAEIVTGHPDRVLAAWMKDQAGR